MKKIFAGIPPTKFIAAASAFTWTIAIANSAGAAQLQEARVTQVVNDVKLLLEQSAPRPAAISDLVRHGTAVRTGTQSRSELTFADLTITRLGANTIFSFKEGTREMNLIDGAILFQVPKGSGGATIRTVGVTAAITGTTGIGEFHPATANRPQPVSKWLCLEGTFHLYLANGQSVEVGPGKMVTTDGKSFSKVLTFDIAKLVSTSLFFTGYDQPLASMNLIMLESENQIASSLLASTTTNPLDPARIVNVTSQAIVAVETQTSPPASPTPPVTPTPPPPTPSKFGTPSVISSPVPYRITNATVITTDPSITTNGVTDYGKIYRGQTDDGAFSLWAFGSTSAFDTALRIDDVFFADPNHLPIAVFKFQSLSLTGDPTIDTTNGVTKLALIGLDGITSGPPGGTLTFTGLDLLALATVNGSINLTSDVSFQNLDELAMYARGAGSNLILNSPISNIGILELAAEGSIYLTNPGAMSVGAFDATAGNNLTLQIGGSLLFNGRVRLDTLVLPGTTLASGADLILNVTGDYTNHSATESSRLRVRNDGAHIGTGGNIAVNIGGDLTTTGTGGDFELVVQNTNGQIDNGGNTALIVRGSIDAAGALSTTLDNTGGIIGSDAISILTSSGAITVQGDATFQILNSDDGVGGSPGQIGGNALIGVSSGGDFSANSLNAIINDRHAGSIGSSAALAFDVGGALSIANDATFQILNSGGTIGGNAPINVSAANMTTNSLLAEINNSNGGMIGGAANIAVNVNQDVTAPNGIDLHILNNSGHIGTGADVLFSVGGPVTPTAQLLAYIDNSGGGMIDNGGNVTMNAVGPVMLDGPLDLEVDNYNAGVISNGANVIAHFAGDVTDTLGPMHSLNFFVINGGNDFFGQLGGGTIGTGGSIALAFDGDVTTTPTATTGSFAAEIANDGGNIGTGGDISLTIGGNLTSSGLFVYTSNRNGGQIGTGGNIAFDVAGDVTTAAQAFFAVLNNGGSIGSNVVVDIHAGNFSVADNLVAEIDNTQGSIGASTEGGATINMNVSGSATVTNNATFQILGSDGAVGGAAITFNGGSYDARGTFLTFIDQDGTITFNNANAHADVLKAGVFGTNGVLNVGGGMLSANTTLKLYAPGNNGTLNFISNVTLSSGTAMDLAANTITIQPSVLVTIAGTGGAANIYTTNANYSGFGGTNPSNGTFGGAGANNPQPLASMPPFGPASPVKLTASGNIPIATAVPPQSAPGRTPVPGGNITSRTRIASPSRGENIADMRRASNVINVRSSDELLSLLDDAAPGPGGKITVRNSKPTNHSKDANRIGAANRLDAASRRNADRRPVDMRTASSSLPRGLMQ